jgi:hypothetical protein
MLREDMVEGKEAPNETNDVSPNAVRELSIIVCPPSRIGRYVHDSNTSGDIASQCSGAIPADRSVETEEGYLHPKFFSLHREQEGCRKSQRVLSFTQCEQDFCLGGMGCFRRQRLMWRLHDDSTVSSKPSSRYVDWNTTLLERFSADRTLES